MPAPEELLEKLEERFIMGEITEETYKELKAKLISRSGGQSTTVGDIGGIRSEGGDVKIGSSEVKTGGHYVGGDYVEDKSDIATKRGQKCPICNVLVKDDYFQCPRCGRDFIHEKHQKETQEYYRTHRYVCIDCFEEIETEYKIKTTPGYLSDGPLPGMQFAYIPGGSFMMGTDVIPGWPPVHKVTLQPFQMQTTPVTQRQWVEIMGNNPSYFEGDDRPVECVSWDDCQEFIKKLNQRDPGKEYRLPSESEWEYACRAGTTTRFYTGADESDLDRAGWYEGNSEGESHPVAQKEPNVWGLYDMHGNVNEWSEDAWHSHYKGAPDDGSAWIAGGSHDRVLRGGSGEDGPNKCRSTDRSQNNPRNRFYYYGFRLAYIVW